MSLGWFLFSTICGLILAIGDGFFGGKNWKKFNGYNVQPICNDPIDGGVTTDGPTRPFLRLCVNPKHRNDPSYETYGSVWHRQTEWFKEGKKK